MRRILEKLWGSARERVVSIPNAPRLLSQARASLGMDAGGATGDGSAVAAVGTDGSAETSAAPKSVVGEPGGGRGMGVGAEGGRQGSRGMREELSSSKRRQYQQQQQTQSSGCGTSDGGGGGGGRAGVVGRSGESRGREDVKATSRSRSTATAGSQQQEGEQPPPPPPPPPSSSSSSRFFETYVFLEEFLKELFCALSAKNGVESDAQDLSESHRKGSAAEEVLRNRLMSVDVGDTSPRETAVASVPGGGGHVDGERNGGGGGKEGDGVGELPTSLDELLKEAAFPTFVSPPVKF